jgi:16S rRNA (cytosine967-C5)-methyltransferase
VNALAHALRDAAAMVARVAAGASLAAEFDRFAEEGGETPRAALLDLSHGTLRRYGRVQGIVRELSRRDRTDALVEALLWCSLYALESGRYAEYTVVDQAVRACGLLERWSAKGYVNALLRGFLRERGSLEARLQADD